MRGSLWTIAVIVVFLALLVPAMGFAFEGALSQDTIEDEPVTLSTEENVSVDPPNDAEEFSQDIELVDADGEELTEGVDYVWNSTTGEIETLESNLDNETVEATYAYEYYAEETTDVMAVLGIIDGWIVALLLFVAMGAMMAWSNFGGGFTGGR